MKEGKDIVDISAPFIAGIVSGSWMLRHSDHVFLWASFSALLLFSSTGILCFRRLRKMGLLNGLLFLTGWFCFNSAYLSQAFELSFNGSLLLSWKEDCSQIISSLPFSSPDSNALVKALLLGDKSELDPEIVSAFRKSGGAHILALSGLHLGILYLIIHHLLKWIGNRPFLRFIRAFLIFILSGFYVLMTGATPSLVRAFLFILIHELSLLLHRKIRLDHTLCSALFIQLVLNPLVIREIGFQLSYLAMAGICWLYPLFKRRNLGHPILQKIWDRSALTLSCQIFTAPAAYYYFGSFPVYFLLTNLLALPLTSLILFLSLLLVGLGSIKIFPTFLSEIGNDIIQSLIYIMEIISSL